MKIYVCDKCGHRMEVKTGIVGNEFDYTRHFGTLTAAYRTAGVVDLCTPCLGNAEAALSAARKEQQEAVQAGFFARFFGGKR